MFYTRSDQFRETRGDSQQIHGEAHENSPRKHKGCYEQFEFCHLVEFGKLLSGDLNQEEAYD